MPVTAAVLRALPLFRGCTAGELRAPLTLLVLEERALLGLLAELPCFSRRVLEAMARRLRAPSRV
jgi:hypothetical protein